MEGRTMAYATFALCAGPYFFYRGFRDLQLKRLLQNTPTSHIRSMSMGLVEVSGRVNARSELVAPFSGKACAYWDIDISTPFKNSWSVVHHACSKHPFYIDDGTGVALAYPDGADCKLPFAEGEICQGNSLPEPYASYVKEHDNLDLTMARMGQMRFRERLIDPGQQVFVLGSAFPRATSVSVSDDDVLAATGTDDPFAARLRAIDERLVGVIRKGQNDPHFIISLESPLSLEVGLGTRSVLELFGGPVLTLAGLGYWLMYIKAYWL
jgi:hypothetical protein